jgi:hypothetical protein
MINGPITNDAIYTEVVARLENKDIAFGFVLKIGDGNLPSRLAMFSLLKDAYFHKRQVVVYYNITEGKKTATRRVEVVDKRGFEHAHDGEIFMVYLLLVFGFDIHKPSEVSRMYPFHICNNFGQSNRWTSTKKFHDSVNFIFL